MTMGVALPPDQSPARCPYCNRPFPDAEILTLHKGRVHSASLSADERAAVSEARETETSELRTYQFRALGAAIVLYFLFLFTYAVAT